VLFIYPFLKIVHHLLWFSPTVLSSSGAPQTIAPRGCFASSQLICCIWFLTYYKEKSVPWDADTRSGCQ
jgi:hypothetical protein